MADSVFGAPPGPPPPRAPEVPAGWLARWNEQYKEWFYVNTITKKSQWEKPTAPARPIADSSVPPGPPPSYTPSNGLMPSDTKRNPYDHDAESEDARLARRLQEEEDAKARSYSPSGAAGPYPSTTLPPGTSDTSSVYPDQLPPRPDDRDGGKSRGLLGKIFGGGKRPTDGYPGAGYRPQGPYAPQPAYGQPGYGGPQYGGGYPQPGVGYGGYPQPGGYYQGPPQEGYYGGGGYAPEPPVSSRTGRTGGLGMAGGAALGVGAGLLGGVLLEDVIQDHDQSMYQQGFDNGEMADGGDYGGGDFGGGDF